MSGWVWLLLVGCAGDPPKPPPAPVAPAPAPTPPPAPEVPAWKILAPSPLELEKTVVDAGIADGLAALVGATPPAVPPDEKDRVAFRTGVVFAQTLLAGRTAPKPELVARLKELRDGMEAVGTGAGLLSSMDKAIEGVKNDVLSRDDLRREIDEHVSNSVPEEGWGPNDTTGPLLQAGAWVEGIHLAAKAVVAKNDPAAADKVLRHPEVPEFFLGYVKSGEGKEKAGSMGGKVAETLARLRDVSAKPTLDLADAAAIVDATDGLLKLL